MNSNNDNMVFSAFRDLVRKRVPEESCDLCSAPLDSRHAHLLEVAQRQVMCACTPCAVLFTDSMTRFRRIPRDVRHLPDCRLTDEHWAGLGIPINLAFVFRSSVTGLMTSLYPSPAGAIESLSPADVWEEIATDEPRLAKMQDDVQAFLVNRLAEPYQYYMAPIDKCFELVGTVRLYWKGFTGGTEVWKQVANLFARLKATAECGPEVWHA